MLNDIIVTWMTCGQFNTVNIYHGNETNQQESVSKDYLKKKKVLQEFFSKVLNQKTIFSRMSSTFLFFVLSKL